MSLGDIHLYLTFTVVRIPIFWSTSSKPVLFKHTWPYMGTFFIKSEHWEDNSFLSDTHYIKRYDSGSSILLLSLSTTVMLLWNGM